jgi:tetratricopeptide (TPR) repeat protein
MRKTSILGMLVMLGAPAPAWAEENAANASDAATERARKLHMEGDALYESKAYPDAYAAYIAAWALKKHFQIAGNLGDCEIQLGKYRDAAEHLATFIRGYPKDQPPERLAKAQRLYEEAVAHVGTLRVMVSSAGAEVFVDGVSAGSAPIKDALYVEPGAHLVEARQGKALGWENVEIRAGEARNVDVEMQVREEAAARPEVVTPAPSKWPGVAAGTGLALVAAGAGVGLELWAQDRAEARERLPLTRDNASSIHEIAAQETMSRRLSIGAFAVGGAVALGTLIYAVWPQQEPTPRNVGASVYVVPGSAGVSVLGRF